MLGLLPASTPWCRGREGGTAGGIITLDDGCMAEYGKLREQEK